MKKILLVNEGASDNLGDQAIKFTLEKLIENNNCEVDFIDFTRLKKNVKKTNQSSIKNKKILKKIIPQSVIVFFKRVSWLIANLHKIKRIAENKKYDMLLIGGGQLILSNTLFPIAMFSWVTIFKKIYNIKTVLVGVGAGNNFKKVDNFLYSQSLKQVDSIHVRDPESVKTLNFYFDVSAKSIPDVVFYISKIINRTQENTNKVLVGIVNFSIYKRYNPDGKTEKEYMDYWQNEILNLFSKGKTISLFYTSSEDISQMLLLRKMLKTNKNIDLAVMKINTLDELIFNISNSELIVSGRMHPLIIGISYNREVKPVIISEKIKTFNKSFVEESISISDVQNEINLKIRNILTDK